MSIIDASLYEPIVVGVNADTTLYTADSETWPTADGGALAGAQDFVDADVIPAVAVGEPGGGYYQRPRPYPIEGYGDGLLPQLEGEALGAIGVIGGGQGQISLRGAAEGAAGVAGRSAGRLVIRGAAIGVRGQVGTAVATLKGLSVGSHGVVAVRGTGAGVITLEATGSGRHDDDEAAIMTILLAA